MNIVLFEDHGVSRLSPIALCRPAFSILCGGLRLVDIVRDLVSPGGTSQPTSIRGLVRPHLAPLLDDYLPPSDQTAFQPSAGVLYLNARIAPTTRWLEPLRSLCQTDRPFRVSSTDDECVALWVPGYLSSSRNGRSGTASDLLALQADDRLDHRELPELQLLRYPHDVLQCHESHMAESLRWRVRHTPQVRELIPGVFGPHELTLPEQVAWDTSLGPILLGENVQIGPFSVLQGPLSLDRDTIVSPHTWLRSFVAAGHTTKLGGEIGKSIIEPLSNKPHYGHLGNAYLGSWVNLGAGSTNSNLKNTYGPIRVEYGDDRIDTGMQFLGCFIGDYTKLAINTSVLTGKVLGVCSNVYGWVASNVASFTNYGPGPDEISEHPVDVMIVTQQRAFARRNKTQRPCDIQLIHDLYTLENCRSQLANPSLGL